MRTLIITYTAMLLLVSCATVAKSYKNPVEEAAVSKGQYARVIFYDNTNRVAYPSSSRIGIEVILDGMLVSRLKWNQRIEVYVKKGRHDLMLTHWDVFKFKDNYEIELTEDSYLIEVRCNLVTTDFEIKQELSNAEGVSQ